MIKKTVGDNKKCMNNKLKFDLWADWITKKDATGRSPFELVYGVTVTFPIKTTNI